MKASRFNFSFPNSSGGELLFNAASAALAEVESEHVGLIHSLLTEEADSDNPQAAEFSSCLEQSRFTVSDNAEELESLRSAYNHARATTDLLQLTIAPTLACNLRCQYCFESNRKGSMSDSVERAVLEFITKRLPHCRELSITWFGGEPTLRIDIIERLSAAVRNLANQHKIKLHPAGIVSNGYLLDAAMAKRLADCGVAVAQVTLDGPAEIHDQRRPHAAGRGSYEQITANIAAAREFLQIAVRVNVDRNNIAAVMALFDDLKERHLLDRTSLQFAPVTSGDGACADIGERCYSSREFAQTLVDIYEALLARGYTDVEYPLPLQGVFCGAARDNAFVIAPDGRLYKCWEQIGNASAACGSVFDSIPPADASLDSDPFGDRECRECAVLPLCLGGCPVIAKNNPHSKEERCATWKYNLGPMLGLKHRSEQLTAREEVNV